MLWLILLSVLLALTKKTGVYFVILCNVALLFVPGVRRRWAEWLASLALPAVLLLVLLPKVLFPMFAIFPGGKQESIGFTMQMSARTYLDHKDALSDGELRILSEVMDLKKVEEDYSSYNYDEVKKLFNYSATEQQISAYKRLWLRLFVRYPFSGIKALLGTAAFSRRRRACGSTMNFQAESMSKYRTRPVSPSFAKRCRPSTNGSAHCRAQAFSCNVFCICGGCRWPYSCGSSFFRTSREGA